MKYNTTIVACSSALVNQPISIVRVSGEESHLIINKVINKPIKDFNNKIYYRQIIDKTSVIDQVLINTFSMPNTFTGENMIEINCHGNIYLIEKIISLLISQGCVMAKSGEFLQRAFVNNKINAIEAQSINDLIISSHFGATKVAITNLQKKTILNLKTLRKSILDVISNIEINIDYPEYDGVTDLQTVTVTNFLNKIIKRFSDIIKISYAAKTLRDGINVAIIGKPNVGKSSLINALLKEEKAIVSKIKGTTRDAVEGRLCIGNLMINLIDTAGIRKSKNKIENIGISKSFDIAKKADLVLIVLDGSLKKLSNYEIEIINKINNKILVVNKSDLKQKINLNCFQDKINDKIIKISAINRDINSLIEMIKIRFKTKNIFNSKDIILTSVNQIGILNKIKNNLILCQQNCINCLPLDIISIDLQTVWYLIGELIGESLEETVIDNIFRNYCLGK